MYTGKWVATVDPAFDGWAFVRALPDLLPEGYHVHENMPTFPFPTVSFFYGSAYIGATSDSLTDGRKFVEVLAVSGCGEFGETPAATLTK